MAQIRRLLRSSGFRLAAFYAGVFAVSLGLLLSALYWTVSNALEQQVRDSIQTEMSALIATFANEGAASLFNEITERESVPPDRGGIYFLALDAKGLTAGNIAITTRSDGWQTLPPGAVPDPASSNPARTDEDHRFMGLGKHLPDGSYLLVGGDVFRMLSAQESILTAFAWTAAIGVMIACLGGLLVGRRILHQINLINSTARAIMGGNLRQRIPTRGTADELDRLSASLNAMLDRIQALLDSLQHVSSNIAHDLRTPLGRLRQSLESSLGHATTVPDFRAAVEEAIGEADTLLNTFSALLRISNIEAGARRAAFRHISLSDVFTRVADAYGAVVEEGGRSLTTAIQPDVTMSGDFELLVQMLANLVENAIGHTPEGSQIVLTLRQEGDGAIRASIADNGPGIPVAEHEKVFERFYRMDASRSSPGTGLGLSLVAAIAQLHHIEIKLEDGAPGLTVSLAAPPYEKV